MIEIAILQLDFFGLFSNINAFLALMILLFAMVGFLSGKLSTAAFGAFLAFVHIAQKSDITLYTNLLYVIVTLTVVFLGFRIVSFGMADEGETP